MVVLLALALRVGAAARADSLWRDEVNDVFVCRNSATVADLLWNLRAEGSPPLRFLAECAVHRLFPAAIWPARAMVVTFGTAAAALTIVIGWRAFGAVAGVVAGVLTATSPFFIRFSVDLRGYGQLQLTAALYGVAMLHLVERPTPGRAVLAGLAGGALLLTHYYGAFLILAASVFALIEGRRDLREGGMVVLSGLVAGLLFSPWLPAFVAQATGDLRPWAVPNSKGIDLVRVLFLPAGRWSVVVAVVALVIGALALRRPRRALTAAPTLSRERVGWGLLAAGALGGNVLAWLAQFAESLRARLEPWYLIGMAIWLTPLIGWGIARLLAVDRPRGSVGWPGGQSIDRPGSESEIAARNSGVTGWRWVAVAVVLAGIGLSQVQGAHAWLQPRSPAPTIARLIEDNARPDDLILVLSAPLASTLNFYYRGDLEQWAPPFRGRVTNMPWPGLLDRMEDETLRGHFVEALRAHLRQRRRVWLVSGGALAVDPAFAWSDEVPDRLTRYHRATVVAARQFLRVLYSHGRPVRFDGVPKLDYWEPGELVLFEPLR